MRFALLAATLGVLFVAAPVAAVIGWGPPTRVVASVSPLSPDAVMDADGYIHVAWLEDWTGIQGIFYATNRTGSWVRERVTTGDNFYARPSIAVDSANHAYIAFARLSCADPDCDVTSRIWVANNKSGSWIVNPRTAGDTDLEPSLVVHNDKLYMAFTRQHFPLYGAQDSGLWYATNAGGTWAETQVASAFGKCFVDQFPSLDIDANGKLFIAYTGPRGAHQGCGHGYGAGMRLATNATGSWVRTTVSTNQDDVAPSLALGADGRPRITFWRAGVGLYYTRQTVSGWTPFSYIADGETPAMVLDGNGVPRVAYESSGEYYAVRSGSGWVKKHVYNGPVDQGTWSGPAIVVSDAGKATVIFARADASSEDDLGIYTVQQQ
jgi:hypothetical protein